VRLIPAEHTRVIVENELEGARGWAERHGIPLEWLPETLILRATLVQPETNATFFLRGSVADYRCLPPAWTFTDKDWQTTGRPIDFPGGVPTRFGASIFITHNQTAVICVPFNRLAYTDQRGPHGDWGGSANWPNAGPSYVHADTIGDMLQAIYRDFLCTREYMSNP
jgi:hypothetical protein